MIDLFTADKTSFKLEQAVKALHSYAVSFDNGEVEPGSEEHRDLVKEVGRMLYFVEDGDFLKSYEDWKAGSFKGELSDRKYAGIVNGVMIREFCPHKKSAEDWRRYNKLSGRFAGALLPWNVDMNKGEIDGVPDDMQFFNINGRKSLMGALIPLDYQLKGSKFKGQGAGNGAVFYGSRCINDCQFGPHTVKRAQFMEPYVLMEGASFSNDSATEATIYRMSCLSGATFDSFALEHCSIITGEKGFTIPEEIWFDLSDGIYITMYSGKESKYSGAKEKVAYFRGGGPEPFCGGNGCSDNVCSI